MVEPASASDRAKVCFLSRRRGWVDPDRPGRPTYEVNLLAVYLGSSVWTLGTAWESIFRRMIPLEIERPYRKAMARTRLTDEEVGRLRGVADVLRVRLEVID